MSEVVEYLTFTQSNIPSEEVKSYIVQMANLLDEEMIDYCKQSYGSCDLPKPSIRTVADFDSDFLSTEDSRIMLLLVNSSPVGYCWWAATDLYASIYNVYVLTSDRRRGRGSSLVKAVLSRIKDEFPNNSYIGLDTIPSNTQAQEFYSKLGFLVDCISYRYDFSKIAESKSIAVDIDLDSAPMIVLNELYLASLQPSKPMVIVRGPDAEKLFRSVWDLARELDVFSKHLDVRGPNALKMRDSYLLATEESEPDGVDVFRGRNLASVFNLPGSKPASTSMDLSLMTSKPVGLGRVYNVVNELSL